MPIFQVNYADGLMVTEESATEYQAAINAIKGDINFKSQIVDTLDTNDVPKVLVINTETQEETEIEGEMILKLIYLSNHCPDEISANEEEGKWQNEKEWRFV